MSGPILVAMSELVIVAFKGDKERAAAVLGELRERDDAWTAHLHGALALYRDDRGQLSVDQSYETTRGQGAVSGGLVGSLVGIALATLLLPLTAGASAPLIGGALLAGAIGGTVVGSHHGAVDSSWWKSDLGVPAEFVDKVRAEVGSCDSAIAVMLPQAESGLAERFATYGGTVMQTELTAEQTLQLRSRMQA